MKFAVLFFGTLALFFSGSILLAFFGHYGFAFFCLLIVFGLID